MLRRVPGDGGCGHQSPGEVLHGDAVRDLGTRCRHRRALPSRVLRGRLGGCGVGILVLAVVRGTDVPLRAAGNASQVGAGRARSRRGFASKWCRLADCQPMTAINVVIGWRGLT